MAVKQFRFEAERVDPVPAADAPLPPWHLVIGAWGDVLASLGPIQQRLRQAGQPATGILHYGFDPHVCSFLRAQPWVREARQLVPVSRLAYATAARKEEHWLRALLDPAGIDAGEVADASLDFAHNRTAVVRWAAGPLPEGAAGWARQVLASLPDAPREHSEEPAGRYLLFPYSFESCGRAAHWPHWLDAIQWLLAHTPHTYLLCGLDWQCRIRHPRLVDLLGQSPSMPAVFALAEGCDGVIGTAAGLSVWETLRGRRPLVVGHERLQPGTFFNRWLRDCEPLPADAPLGAFAAAAAEFFAREPVTKPAVYSPADFGGPDRCLQLCLPSGIGDISWVYSKVRHLKARMGREVLVYLPAESPARGAPFVAMLPDVHWGGYLSTTTSWQVLSQCLPDNWPPHMELAPFHGNGHLRVVNAAANIHLEMGRPLAEFWPGLPTDYHYPLDVPLCEQLEAEARLRRLHGVRFAVYVSNRDKEKYVAEGWALWSVPQWAEFLGAVAALAGPCGFALLGAEYDRDKTEAVAAALEADGHAVERVIGRPLGTALECIRQADYCFAYPSGLGILANVLRTPALMLLPRLLPGLEQSFADPEDLASGRYRCMVDPTPEAALAWFQETGIAHLRCRHRGAAAPLPLPAEPARAASPAGGGPPRAGTRPRSLSR